MQHLPRNNSQIHKICTVVTLILFGNISWFCNKHFLIFLLNSVSFLNNKKHLDHNVTNQTKNTLPDLFIWKFRTIYR